MMRRATVQFLATALGALCRDRQVAPGLVGSVQDLRDYVAYRLGTGEAGAGEPPPLAGGWRAQVIGSQLDEILAGTTVLRVGDPWAEQPLRFEPPGA